MFMIDPLLRRCKPLGGAQMTLVVCHPGSKKFGLRTDNYYNVNFGLRPNNYNY
jgi:hypothetical protein